MIFISNLIWIAMLPIMTPVLFLIWFLKDPVNILKYLTKHSMIKASWVTLRGR